jgi:nicotinamide mononucleotide transporter
MEVLGLISGLLCVWLLIKENIWTFPIGLLYALITVVVVYNERLFADVILNFYYVVMNAFGWYFWLFGGQSRRSQDALEVGVIPLKQIAWIVLIMASGTLLMGWGFSTYSNADLAYADSFTTVASFIAMYLAAKKYLESWYLWFVVDVVQVILYLVKGIELYALLYLIYLGMAYWGWRAWKASIRQVVIEP